MRKNNRDRIVEWFNTHKSLTALECSDSLRITSLSQEISRLEQDGYVFDHSRENNEETHWTRYTLIQRPFKLELVG